MPFKPGQSGNPNGAPRRINQAARLAREHTEKAINALLEALADDKTENRIKAASTLLDRGWGKPQEFVEHSTDQEQVEAMEENIVNKLLSSLPTETLQKLADEYTRPDDYTVRH